MISLPFRAALLGGLLSVSASSQGTIEPGFEYVSSTLNPAPFSVYVTLEDGSRVHFDGNTVIHTDAYGGFLQTLHVFSSFSFTGAIAADPSGDSVLVGESTTGELYRVELDGTGATYLTTLPYNYSASYQSPGVVYVSAAVCGWPCGNDIFRVDTQTGATSTAAQVSGPSGPVSFSSDGDLYYGTSTDTFPAPAGSCALWKFSAEDLASSMVLGDSDAGVVNGNIDPISSIAIDPVMMDLVVSTNLFDRSFNVVSDEILLLRPDGTVKDTISKQSGGYRSTVELRSVGGLGHFRAFQPEGVALTWLESDGIHQIKPKRPTSAVIHNGGGSHAFVVSGAEPYGAMLLTYGNSSAHQGAETSYQLSFDFLYHTGLPISQTRRVGQFLVPCDEDGTATFPFYSMTIWKIFI